MRRIIFVVLATATLLTAAPAVPASAATTTNTTTAEYGYHVEITDGNGTTTADAPDLASALEMAGEGVAATVDPMFACFATTVSVTYYHKIFLIYTEDLWRLNLQVKWCGHWTGHYISNVGQFAYFDKVATLWFPMSRSTWTWNNGYYTHRAGYPKSGYKWWLQAGIQNCIGGISGIGCIKQMNPIVWFIGYDDGKYKWDASVGG